MQPCNLVVSYYISLIVCTKQTDHPKEQLKQVTSFGAITFVDAGPPVTDLIQLYFHHCHELLKKA